MQETRIRSLGREDPLEKGMATHSSVLAWKIPWTEEPGGLQSTRSQSRTRLRDSPSPLLIFPSLANTVSCISRSSAVLFPASVSVFGFGVCGWYALSACLCLPSSLFLPGSWRTAENPKLTGLSAQHMGDSISLSSGIRSCEKAALLCVSSLIALARIRPAMEVFLFVLLGTLCDFSA